MKSRTLNLLACSLVVGAAGCARPSVAVKAIAADQQSESTAVSARAQSANKLVVRAQAAEPAKGADPARATEPARAAEQGSRFTFSADKGGQALRQILPPAAALPVPLRDQPPGPRELTSPATVARPSIPLASNQGELLRPPLPKPLVLRPRMLGEDAPFTAYRGEARPPDARELDTGARVALSGRDVNVPAPLGWLGLPVPDRVPLDDPTAEASVQAALATVPPQRSDPVPFAPQNLPDPFQNAQTVKLKTPPAEEPTPSPFVGSKPPPPAPQPPPKQ